MQAYVDPEQLERVVKIVANGQSNPKVQKIINYRVGVLGMFEGSKDIARTIWRPLDKETVSKGFNIVINYLTDFFGMDGRFDMKRTATDMASFRPNYLVIASRGRGQSGVEELVRFSQGIDVGFGQGNPGAYRKQSPYHKVFLTDAPLPSEQFKEYQRLKKAMKFYADEDNYSYDLDDKGAVTNQVMIDGGEMARQALGGAE